MRRFLLLFVVFLMSICVFDPACARQRGFVPKVPQFIKADGTGFTLGEKPYFVAGINNHYLTWGTDLEVNRVLDDAVALGANTVRIFLQSVIGSFDGTMPTIWDFRKEGMSSTLAVHGTYLLYWDSKLNRMAINDGPNGLQRVDRVIAEAKKRNLHLIIAFLDSWAYTGGAQQVGWWYRAWPQDAEISTELPTDWHFFYADTRTRRDYQDWVKHVIEHVNYKTKLRYRDDPTIMAWELLNEPIMDSDGLRAAWTSEMSEFVKLLDPNHLVGAGSINRTIKDLTKDLVIPTLDYATWHGYPIYDKNTPEQFNARIPQYCQTAAEYKKPVLLEEFGWARSNPNQAEWYKTWLDTITNNRDCAGWAVWVMISRQQNGGYPPDEHDQFNVINDGGQLWTVLRGETLKGKMRGNPRDMAREG